MVCLVSKALRLWGGRGRLWGQFQEHFFKSFFSLCMMWPQADMEEFLAPFFCHTHLKQTKHQRTRPVQDVCGQKADLEEFLAQVRQHEADLEAGLQAARSRQAAAEEESLAATTAASQLRAKVRGVVCKWKKGKKGTESDGLPTQ